MRPFVVYGISLGATTGIRAAALQPGWDAVIAQQPFNDPVTVMPNFQRFVPWWLRWYANERRLQRALPIAERRAGFSFEAARLAPLLADYRVPTLIEHGTDDQMVPAAQSAEIAAAAPQVIDRYTSGGDHITFPLSLWNRCPMTMGWLETTLGISNLLAACDRIIYDDPDDILDEIRAAEAD